MTWKHPQAETRVAEGTFYMYKQSMLEMKKDINVGLVYMHKDSQVKSKGSLWDLFYSVHNVYASINTDNTTINNMLLHWV